MTTYTLETILKSAFEATDSPEQAAGIEFNPEEHKVLGDIPLSVRYLHNATVSLSKVCDRLHELYCLYCESKEDPKEERALAKELLAAKELWHLCDNIRLRLLQEAYPQLYNGDYVTAAILKNWQIAGVHMTAEEKSCMEQEQELIELLLRRG